MSVSGLLITKNNGVTLDWALESVYRFLDEIVIIDDFSTDRTVEIAQKYGAKVYAHHFENFAAQRNYGIEKCTGDWIFTMDADEVMGENLGEAFSYLHRTRYRAFLFPRYNLVHLDPLVIINSPHHYSEWQVRIFVNDGRSTYINPVHHQLQDCRPRLKIPFVNIFHFHYLLHDYDTRKKRVDYYEAIEKGAGFPACYLFEDYPHTYLYGVEHIEKNLMEKLKREMVAVTYDYQVNEKEQRAFERSLSMKTKITKIRSVFGI
jgi:glycosyltransferases involved in cell wall biogenesis